MIGHTVVFHENMSVGGVNFDELVKTLSLTLTKICGKVKKTLNSKRSKFDFGPFAEKARGHSEMNIKIRSHYVTDNRSRGRPVDFSICFNLGLDFLLLLFLRSSEKRIETFSLFGAVDIKKKNHFNHGRCYFIIPRR